MKKILGKLLAFILAVVIAACGFIVLCEINPDVAKGASEASAGLNTYIKSRAAQEEEGNGSAATEAAAEVVETATEQLGDIVGELADAASTVSSYTVIEKQEKEFAEYEGEWSSKGINKEIVSEAVEPLVNQDLSEDPTDDTTYYSITDDMSGLYVPERTVIVLESSEDVQKAISDTGMGYTYTDVTFDSTYYPYYYMLTSKCRELYKQIYGNAVNLNDTFIPVEVATPEEWNNALLSVVFDHPELFWLDTRQYTEYDYKGNVVKVKIFFYEDELGDIYEAQTEFARMISALLAGTDELKTDYEKEVYIHDLLAAKLNYSPNPLDQSAYSAIVGNETVCAGYSKAFQVLMQQLGIPTYLSVGWGGGLVSGDMHAWNIIKLDKDYYNVDVTWDDQVPINYNYFNQSDTDFHRHIRMFNSQYLPACNGKKYVIS